MISPLMYLFSCLDEGYNVDEFISLRNMTSSDQKLIRTEAHRLCSIVCNPDRIFFDDYTGFAGDVQCVGSTTFEPSPATRCMLTRLKEVATKFEKVYNSAEVLEEMSSDLSSNRVVLEIEHRDTYAYNFVSSVISSTAPWEKRIAKIKEVCDVLQSRATVSDKDTQVTATYSRSELHSRMSYWARLWVYDYIQYNHCPFPETITADTFQRVASELRQLGFAGFTNPLIMYQDFNSSRVESHTEVKIAPEIIAFLDRAYRSGGVSVADN